MTNACRQLGERRPQGPPPFAGVERKYEPPEGYNARHDPNYRDRVIVDLCSHWGEYRHLEETIGGAMEEVRDALVVLRDYGFVVEAEPGRPGYRVVGYHYRPYLRAERVGGRAQMDMGADLPISEPEAAPE